MGRSATVTLRRARAMDMRRAGKSYGDIADELGYASAGSASKDVSRALDQVIQEAGDQLIKLERERTEGLLAILWPLAEKGDVRAARECTRLLERRARLLGLDKTLNDREWQRKQDQGDAGKSLIGSLFLSLRNTPVAGDPDYNPDKE